MLGRQLGKDPEGPSTQYLMSLVLNTAKGMVSGTRNLKCWVLGPSGYSMVQMSDVVQLL